MTAAMPTELPAIRIKNVAAALVRQRPVARDPALPAAAVPIVALMGPVPMVYVHNLNSFQDVLSREHKDRLEYGSACNGLLG